MEQETVTERSITPAVALAVAPPRRRSWNLSAYGWISPAIFLITIATLIPIAFTIYISLTNYSQLHPFDYHIVGLKNYARAFSTDVATGYLGSYAWLFGWTMVFAAACTVLNVGVGLVLAMMLNNPRLPGRLLFRALLILPWAMPFFITAAVWRGILNSDFGAVNILLRDLHLYAPAWLDDPNLAKLSLIMVNLWFSFPFFMVTSLGVLQSIPTDLYEAGDIDGTSMWTRFRHITLPGIRPAMMPLAVAQFAFQFNNALIVYAITTGNPPSLDASGRGETDILASFLYKLVATSGQYAQAAALGVLIFILVMILSIINVRLTGAFREST